MLWELGHPKLIEALLVCSSTSQAICVRLSGVWSQSCCAHLSGCCPALSLVSVM